MEFGYAQAALAIVGLVLLLNCAGARRVTERSRRLGEAGGLADEWQRRYERLGSPSSDVSPDSRDGRTDPDR